MPKPPEVNGPFQDQPRAARGPAVALPTLYKDQMVVAFRMPAQEQRRWSRRIPAVTSSGGSFTYADLTTRTLCESGGFAAECGQSIVDSDCVRHAADGARRDGRCTGQRRARRGSNTDGVAGGEQDGVSFTKVIDLPTGGVYQRTFAFAPVTGKYFRYRLWALTAVPFRICRFQLHTAMPVNRFEEKAAFATVPNYYEIATPEADETSTVKKTDVVDLTGKMRPGWDAGLDGPCGGDWMVLRMGYALTGATECSGASGGDGI